MRKRASIHIYIAGVFFLLYVMSLFFISREQNPYCVEMEMTQALYSVDLVWAGNLEETPVVISNPSSRAVSSQLGIDLGYHLYRVVGNTQELVSSGNIRTSVPNICPGESREVRLRFEIPAEGGTYILYADLVEEDGIWYSEHGMQMPHITIEVH